MALVRHGTVGAFFAYWHQVPPPSQDVAPPVWFSPDSRWLADDTGDGNLWLVPLEGQPVGHQGLWVPASLGPPSFSTDGRWVAYSGGDETVRLGDLKALARPREPDSPSLLARVFPNSRGLPTAASQHVIAFTPGGKIVAAQNSSFAWLLTLDFAELISVAQRTAGRNLTLKEWRQYFPAQEYRRVFSDLPDPPDLGSQPGPGNVKFGR